MEFSNFMICGCQFTPNTKFLATVSGANEASSTSEPMYLTQQYHTLKTALNEFYMSLKANPIEAVVPICDLLRSVPSEPNPQIPIFKVDKRLIREPESAWVKTGLGLGPVERAYNNAIQRLEEICNSHRLDLKGHNTAESWEYGYIYCYILK